MRLQQQQPMQAILQVHPSAVPQRHSEVSAVRHDMYAQDTSPYDQPQFPQPRSNSPYAHHPPHPGLPPPEHQPQQPRGRKRKSPPVDQQTLNPGFEYTSNSDYSPAASAAPQEDQSPTQPENKTGPGGRQLSTSKRAEQNRKAQRAFRERRDQHVKMLESRSQMLDAAIASAEEANRRWEECRTLVDQLRAENAALRVALQQTHHHQAHMPPPPGMIHQTLAHLPPPPPPDQQKSNQGSRSATPGTTDAAALVGHSRTPSVENPSGAEVNERNGQSAAGS